MPKFKMTGVPNFIQKSSLFYTIKVLEWYKHVSQIHLNHFKPKRMTQISLWIFELQKVWSANYIHCLRKTEGSCHFSQFHKSP